MIKGLRYDGRVQTALGRGLDAPAECLRAAAVVGLEAVCLADHYESDEGDAPSRLRAYRQAAHHSRLHVVAGAECDILDEAGHLTLPASSAAGFSLVFARLSSRTEGIGREVPVRPDQLLRRLREALVAACRRPHVNVLGMPFNLGRFPAPLSPADIPPDLVAEVGAAMVQEEVACELSHNIWWWYPDLPLADFTEEYATVLMALSAEGVKFLATSGARSGEGIGNLRYVERLAEAARLERSQLVNLALVEGISD
jgi:histidinol phosphatase-like PHP family hydrolase